MCCYNAGFPHHLSFLLFFHSPVFHPVFDPPHPVPVRPSPLPPSQTYLLSDGKTWNSYSNTSSTEVLRLYGLSSGYQYRVSRFTYPANTTSPGIDWTIVVVIDVGIFSSAYVIDYLIGLPVLGLGLAIISVVAAIILIESLTRPLRRIAEQLNAIAQLTLRANRRRNRPRPFARGRPDNADQIAIEADAVNGANDGSWFSHFVRRTPCPLAGTKRPTRADVQRAVMPRLFSHSLRKSSLAATCAGQPKSTSTTTTCRGGGARSGPGHHPLAAVDANCGRSFKSARSRSVRKHGHGCMGMNGDDGAANGRRDAGTCATTTSMPRSLARSRSWHCLTLAPRVVMMTVRPTAAAGCHGPHVLGPWVVCQVRAGRRRASASERP